jgi:hypothetical protein
MQLTEAMYHFALVITYQGQEITRQKWNGILIVGHHFNTIIFSVAGNTYTLIANKNNLEDGCCKLKKEIICDGSYCDRNALRLQISYFMPIYFHVTRETSHATHTGLSQTKQSANCCFVHWWLHTDLKDSCVILAPVTGQSTHLYSSIGGSKNYLCSSVSGLHRVPSCRKFAKVVAQLQKWKVFRVLLIAFTKK